VRLDGARQLRQLTGVRTEVARTGRARILHGEPIEQHRRVGRVEELDEVMCIRGAGVTSTPVHLADDEAGADGACLLHTSCNHGHERDKHARAQAKTSGFH
jgi:hypothetical protein